MAKRISIGTALETLVKRSGRQKAEVARALQKDPSSLSQVFRESANPTFDTIEELLDELGLDFLDLARVLLDGEETGDAGAATSDLRDLGEALSPASLEPMSADRAELLRDPLGSQLLGLLTQMLTRLEAIERGIGREPGQAADPADLSSSEAAEENRS
ncbi:MAG: helix-turn-helix transcriptional regulator [Acidobacteriota bacterium]